MKQPTGLREKIDVIIDDIVSEYPCQGNANYDGRYTDAILTLLREQVVPKKKKVHRCGFRDCHDGYKAMGRNDAIDEMKARLK